MALDTGGGAAVSLGGLGLGLGNGHAYAATGAILGLSLGSVLLIAGGTALAVVGVWKFRKSRKDKAKADKA